MTSFYRYKVKLTDARRVGAKKGVSIGLSMAFIYFFDFFTYSVAFWLVSFLSCIDLTCILNRFGGFLISEEILLAGDVLAVFFAVIIGAFSLGQAGPNAESLITAAGSAGEVFEIIDRVMILKNIIIYYVILI